MTNNTITTVGDSKRKVFTPGIETATTDRRQGNITDDGIELIEEFHQRVADELPGHDPDFFDGLQYWTASLGRYIIELPDEYVKNQYQETPYPTFYVVKIDSQGGDANPEIFREIASWKHVHDSPVNETMAPVDAWGEDARWCVMRRVFAPTARSDRADSAEIVEDMTEEIMAGEMNPDEIMDTVKNRMHEGDHGGIPDDAPPLWRVESRLHGIGFTIQDPEENCGFDHSIGETCFFDFGGFRHDDIDPAAVDIFDTDDEGEGDDTDTETPTPEAEPAETDTAAEYEDSSISDFV
jgi:hypothetical protein